MLVVQPLFSLLSFLVVLIGHLVKKNGIREREGKEKGKRKTQERKEREKERNLFLDQREHPRWLEGHNFDFLMNHLINTMVIYIFDENNN